MRAAKSTLPARDVRDRSATDERATLITEQLETVLPCPAAMVGR